MQNDDRNRIAHLEGRLALSSPAPGAVTLADLEVLADLYLQADSYQPALETIERLLALPAAQTLSASRRGALESKAVACRLARGDAQVALAQCREILRTELRIEHVPTRARLHLQSAEALFRLGRPEDTRDAAERGLALANTCGDLTLIALGVNLLGRAAYRSGDLVLARERYEEALALYRSLGDEDGQAHLRNNLGLVHKNLCEWDAAIAHLGAALELHRGRGRYGETANPLMNLGIVHQKRGDWPRALECYEEAERVYRSVGDRLRLIVVGLGKGNIARLERRFEDARALLETALSQARQLSASREEVLALEFLGELEYENGRPAAALERYGHALRSAERLAPEGDLVVEIERRRAEALCQLGRIDEAERACDRAERLARASQDRLELAITQRVRGQIAKARGRSHEAVTAWRAAATELAGCRETFELGRTYLMLGEVVTDVSEARRCFYRAGSLFAELSTPFWLEHSERELHDRLGTDAEPAPAAPIAASGRGTRAPRLVACSQPMRRVESLARRAAATDLSVLITGDTGTGKELVARTIHTLSTRAQKPFLAVNCGALRADLALSQLFGHRKGAFTGAHAEGVGLVEAANGGTLFLDEVGELPHDVQVTLLRFLESGEYLRLGETQVRRSDVRVIAATNRELRGRDAEQRFRRDLLFRVNEIEIRVPALHERGDDVLPLARHFIAFYGGPTGPELTKEAEGVLMAHPWPGNVRELENVMKRVAALHADRGSISPAILLPLLSVHPIRRPHASEGDERAEILEAFERAGGNKSRMAELLGVSRKTLYARIKRHEIDLP